MSTMPKGLYKIVRDGVVADGIEGPDGFRVSQYDDLHNQGSIGRCEVVIRAAGHAYAQGWNAALAAVREGTVKP